MNDTGIIPINFQILLKIKKEKEKTETGIYLPSKEVERANITQQIGEIIAMGSNAFKDEKWEKMPESPVEGNSVMFNKHAGMEIKCPNVEDDDEYLYRLCSSDEIRAIIKNNNEINI